MKNEVFLTTNNALVTLDNPQLPSHTYYNQGYVGKAGSILDLLVFLNFDSSKTQTNLTSLVTVFL